MYFTFFTSLVPAKLMREWRALFETGMPLYEERAVEETSDPTVGQVLEEEKLQLLDEGDFMEYKVSHLEMSLVMRKPTFCICENKDADQLRGNREADQRHCFRHTDSTIPLLTVYEILSL